MPRRRFLPWYLLAWAVLAAAYAAIIARQARMPPGHAAVAALVNVGGAAALGLVGWALAHRVSWDRQGRLRFLAVHGLAALAYASLWSLSVLLPMYLSGSEAALAEFVARGLLWQTLIGVIVYALIVGVASALLSARRFREQEAVAARAEAMYARAELRALRAQLNPHFLFNTLHSITALVRVDPDAAERALEQFGALLRYVLDVNRVDSEEVPLAEELEFVRGYLALESLRYGDRLRTREAVDPEALECPVLAFTLQPLVENAVRHGIAPRAAGGTVSLSAAVEGDRLVLEVGDDGAGAVAAQARGGDGVGLSAIGDRLRARYGADAALHVATAPGEGFRVRIELPAT